MISLRESSHLNLRPINGMAEDSSIYGRGFSNIMSDERCAMRYRDGIGFESSLKVGPDGI